MKKILLYFFISILCIVLGILTFFLGSFYRSLPKAEGKVSLDRLSEEVQIVKDDWGVPHIFAQNERDLFVACGYVHAQERMWQMDLYRRAASGRLSEIFGKVTLEKDRLARNFGLKEAASKDFGKLSPEMKELLHSYSYGVNAWIDSRGMKWPPEFLLLRYRPEPWRPQDSLIIKEIMALFLSIEYQREIMRARLIKKLGREKALQILEEGLAIPSYEMVDVSFTEHLGLPGFQGSNSWVLAGDRTESGKPLLANDPHLEITLPPIWYEMHLHCPTMDVIGVSIPGIPLVIIGHNDSIAWGMTYSTADAQDLYIEKLDSDQDAYFDDEGWRPLRKIEEWIRIRGEKEPEKMEILWTEHGPIISPRIVESQSAISLRWVLYEGDRALESFYNLNKAQNWGEFKEALKQFNAPSNNFLYADKHGNIGYYLSGRIPLRKPAAAQFPFPGWLEEGRWQRYLEEEEKPTLFNPQEGFIITANNDIIPEDFPHSVSFEWDAPFRMERIRELLLQREKHDVASLKRIQNDIFSKKAERLFPIIKEIETEEEDLKEILNMLMGWTLEMDSGKEAALFVTFMHFFHREAFEDELGGDFESFDLLYRRTPAGLLRILPHPQSPWFDNKETASIETRENIVKISLERAFQRLRKEYGHPENWDWTKIHSIDFQHNLGQVALLSFFNKGSYPLKGHYFTINASFYADSNHVTHGVSYRQIVDLADFGNSVSIISSGQSGHFLSRHYDDQIPLWLEGLYHPMLFYSDDIKAKARGVIILNPLSREEKREKEND